MLGIVKLIVNWLFWLADCYKQQVWTPWNRAIVAIGNMTILGLVTDITQIQELKKVVWSLILWLIEMSCIIHLYKQYL